MDTLITVGVIVAMSALGAVVLHRLRRRQAGRVAAMRYERLNRWLPSRSGRRHLP